MNIGKILKNLRIERGLTQKELGETLKIGQATIACYESGQREPHILNLISYADFFDCSLDYLVGRADEFGAPIYQANKQKNNTSKRIRLEDKEILDKLKNLSFGNKMKVFGYIDGLKEEK